MVVENTRKNEENRILDRFFGFRNPSKGLKALPGAWYLIWSFIASRVPCTLDRCRLVSSKSIGIVRSMEYSVPCREEEQQTAACVQQVHAQEEEERVSPRVHGVYGTFSKLSNFKKKQEFYPLPPSSFM